MIHDSYFDSEEFRELLTDYEDALEQGRPVFLDSDELVDIADYYEQSGRPRDADRAIDRALELDPTAPGALSFKVGDALDKCDPAQARYYLEQMTDHENVEYTYCQAELLLYDERDDEADELLRQHLDSLGDDDERDDYILDVANLYSEWERPELAIQWMEMVPPREGEDYLDMKGRNLYGVGRYTESADIYRQLIDINPFEHDYWIGLAASQLALGQDAEALESSEYAIAIDPQSADAVVRKANALYRLERYAEALDYFRRYSEMEPDDLSGQMNQALCLVAMNRYAEGAELMERFIPQLNYDQQMLADAYMELAYAYSELERYEDALAALDMTTQLPCDHTHVDVMKGHIMLAAGQLEQAEKCFADAVNHSDTPTRTLLHVIVSLYDNAYLNTAYNMFQRYFKLKEPDCHEGYAYMALCCHDMNRREEYLHWLELACRLNPEEARQALAHLFAEGTDPTQYFDIENH